MNYSIDAALTDLRSLVADLGKGGGSISPSVYDTAQLLRLYPSTGNTAPAIQWLLAQQQADGGWGSALTTYARDVPTLAAILALHTHNPTQQTREVCHAGLTFLRSQASQWAEVSPDTLPIATEMILPSLIEEANACGFTLNPTLYAPLYRLRKHKMGQLAQRPLQVGTPPTYSWEALGTEANALLPDYSGGIGHSPAATAAWLRQAEKHPELSEACVQARHYLAQAAAATACGVPGVVPNVWPITGFERAYGLYILLITGLLEHPALRTSVTAQVDELRLIMQRGHGVSFGEYFTPDADETAVAMAVLQTTPYPADPAFILQFKNGDHFCTFRHELNASVFTNAHALYALSGVPMRDLMVEHFLQARQCADGRWLADKWHSSWLYTTLEVVLALSRLGCWPEVSQAGQLLLREQKADGAWGSGTRGNWVETSYVLTALQTLQQQGLGNEQMDQAVQRGWQWLGNAAHLNSGVAEKLWLGKELYAPYRVDRIYALSAWLAVALERVPV